MRFMDLATSYVFIFSSLRSPKISRTDRQPHFLKSHSPLYPVYPPKTHKEARLTSSTSIRERAPLSWIQMESCLKSFPVLINIISVAAETLAGK